MSKTITIKDLSFRFAAMTYHFFHHLDLELQGGTLYLLTGPNGSGKSTFLRLMRGDSAPGEQIAGSCLLLHNRESKKLAFENAQDRKELQELSSFIPQQFDHLLMAPLTVEENLRLATLPRYPGLYRLPLPLELVQAAEHYKLPLTARVEHLSGGQRQALAICMMLHKQRPLMLLDEPTAALDYHHSSYVISLLNEEASRRALVIIASCHDARLISEHPKQYILQLVVDPVSYRRTIIPC
jgi:ABC-type lipoprotein export system ATPase subunit